MWFSCCCEPGSLLCFSENSYGGRSVMKLIYLWLYSFDIGSKSWKCHTSQTVSRDFKMVLGTIWSGWVRRLRGMYWLTLFTMFSHRHDFEVERKFFLQSMHTCDICFDEKLGQEFFRLNECSHHFCRECLTAYCQMHVKEGSVTQLM